jgi:DNA-binding MarR family transcriptional regulator
MDSLETRATELMGHLGALARRHLFQDRPTRDDHAPLARQEFRVLLSVGEAGATTMGRLARELAASMSSLTSVADRLVAKGMIRRYRSDRDRRVVLLELTEQGRRIHERRRRARLRMATAMLQTLNERERAEFIALMRKIRAGATEEAASPARGSPVARRKATRT